MAIRRELVAQKMVHALGNGLNLRLVKADTVLPLLDIISRRYKEHLPSGDLSIEDYRFIGDVLQERPGSKLTAAAAIAYARALRIAIETDRDLTDLTSYVVNLNTLLIDADRGADHVFRSAGFISPGTSYPSGEEDFYAVLQFINIMIRSVHQKLLKLKVDVAHESLVFLLQTLAIMAEYTGPTPANKELNFAVALYSKMFDRSDDPEFLERTRDIGSFFGLIHDLNHLTSPPDIQKLVFSELSYDANQHLLRCAIKLGDMESAEKIAERLLDLESQ